MAPLLVKEPCPVPLLSEYISLEDSKKMAIEFINCLKKAKHLDAGSPLELYLPLTFRNICEDLG